MAHYLRKKEKETWKRTRIISWRRWPWRWWHFELKTPSVTVISVTKLYESFFRFLFPVTLCCGLAKFTFKSSRMHVFYHFYLCSLARRSEFPQCLPSDIYRCTAGIYISWLLLIFTFSLLFFGIFLITDFLFCDLLLGNVIFRYHYNNLR